MSRWGISGNPVPLALPYAVDVNAACAAVRNGFPPCFAYAVAWRETIREYGLRAADRLQDGWQTLPSNQVGHGLFQLTSSFPALWPDARVNTTYAIANFLLPDVTFWLEHDATLAGDELVQCVAASFNAGPTAAWYAHVNGNVDAATTGGDYAADVLATYQTLAAGKAPT